MHAYISFLSNEKLILVGFDVVHVEEAYGGGGCLGGLLQLTQTHKP